MLALLLGKAGANKPEIVLNHLDTGEELRGEQRINKFFTNIGSKLFKSLGVLPKVSNTDTPH